MDANNAKSNLQKKMLVYARDIALDKLNKKLEKKIAKQEIKRKQNDSPSYRSCSENSDSIRTNSEFTSLSSEMTPLVHSKEKLALRTSTIEPESNDATQKLLNTNIDGVQLNETSIDSSEQDEDFQTADEDEEFPIKKDAIQPYTVRMIIHLTHLCESPSPLIHNLTTRRRHVKKLSWLSTVRLSTLQRLLLLNFSEKFFVSKKI